MLEAPQEHWPQDSVPYDSVADGGKEVEEEEEKEGKGGPREQARHKVELLQVGVRALAEHGLDVHVAECYNSSVHDQDVRVRTG